LENGVILEKLFIAFFRSRFSSRGSGTVSAAKAVDCFSYRERFTAIIPLHVVTITDRYHYSYNNILNVFIIRKTHAFSSYKSQRRDRTLEEEKREYGQEKKRGREKENRDHREEIGEKTEKDRGGEYRREREVVQRRKRESTGEKRVEKKSREKPEGITQSKTRKHKC
jgi:hypothetical protein